MGQVLQFKSNYQPTQRFSNEAIETMGNLLEASYIGEMLDRGFTPADIQEFFAASIDEACSIHQHLKDLSTPEKVEVIDEVSTEVLTEAEGSTTTLSNSNCRVEYDADEKKFYGADLTDHNNEPRFYSQTRRSHKKSFAALQEGFTATTTMYEAMGIIQKSGVKCRSYCAMD